MLGIEEWTEVAPEVGEAVGMRRFGVAGAVPHAAITIKTSAPPAIRDNTRTAIPSIRLHDPQRRTLRRNISSLPSPRPEEILSPVGCCAMLLPTSPAWHTIRS